MRGKWRKELSTFAPFFFVGGGSVYWTRLETPVDAHYTESAVGSPLGRARGVLVAHPWPGTMASLEKGLDRTEVSLGALDVIPQRP